LPELQSFLQAAVRAPGLVFTFFAGCACASVKAKDKAATEANALTTRQRIFMIDPPTNDLPTEISKLQ